MKITRNMTVIEPKNRFVELTTSTDDWTLVQQNDMVADDDAFKSTVQ